MDRVEEDGSPPDEVASSLAEEHIEEMVHDFFRSPAPPATSHEEWLLRLCRHLMMREATVSVQHARGKEGRARCRPRKR